MAETGYGIHPFGKGQKKPDASRDFSLIYIDHLTLLESTLERFESSPWVSVDTEADSLHHYVEKLCLLQISIPAEDFVIDPLASLDLGPLVKTLSQKHLIFHGADFDI